MARKLSMLLLLFLIVFAETIIVIEHVVLIFCVLFHIQKWKKALMRLLVSGGFVGFGLWGSFNVILAPITSHEPESHGIKNVEKMESLN